MRTITRLQLLPPCQTVSRQLLSSKKAVFVLGTSLGISICASPIAMAQVVKEAASSNDTTSSRSQSVRLSTITVTGDKGDIAPYSGGQIATGSRVGVLGNKDFMETPFNTISYTSKYIEDVQAKNIVDVIASTDPSVTTTGIPGESLDVFKIRGFNIASTDITFNGLAGIAPYYRTSPEMLERVEVLKGPSTLLNGMPPNGSVGGTVNLVTKRAHNTPISRITTSYMNDKQLGGHLDIGRRFGENKEFGARFNGVYRKGGSPVKDQNRDTRLMSLGLDWHGDRVRSSLDLYYNKEHISGLSRGLGLAPGVPLPPPPSARHGLNPDWGFTDTSERGGMARTEFDITDDWMTYAAFGATKTKMHAHNTSRANILNSAGDISNDMADLNDRYKRRSAEIGIKGNFDTGPIDHSVTLNGTYFHEKYNLVANLNVLANGPVLTNIYHPDWSGAKFTSIRPEGITTTKTRLRSIGLTDTLSAWHDRVQLMAGIRRQEVKKENYLTASGMRTDKYDESANTPAVGLLFKATDSISLYANYIEGLSSGGQAPNTAENAGEIFSPYKTKQKEAGVKFDSGSFANTISLFEIKKPTGELDVTTNIYGEDNEQRNRGVEWNFFGKPLENVRLLGGVAYTQAKQIKSKDSQKEGKTAVGAPKWQAKLGAEWDLPWQQGLTLTANATTMSKQYIDSNNDVSVPGRTLFATGARYATKMGNHPLTLRADITNLTNKRYWSKPYYQSLGVGEPRALMLSATLDI